MCFETFVIFQTSPFKVVTKAVPPTKIDRGWQVQLVDQHRERTVPVDE
jgi:hypothetical protein